MIVIKIKSIEVDLTKADPADPFRQRDTVCVKIMTTHGVHGDYVELPENATAEDAITAVNLLLDRIRGMSI